MLNFYQCVSFVLRIHTYVGTTRSHDYSMYSLCCFFTLSAGMVDQEVKWYWFLMDASLCMLCCKHVLYRYYVACCACRACNTSTDQRANTDKHQKPASYKQLVLGTHSTNCVSQVTVTCSFVIKARECADSPQTIFCSVSHCCRSGLGTRLKGSGLNCVQLFTLTIP